MDFGRYWSDETLEGLAGLSGKCRRWSLLPIRCDGLRHDVRRAAD